MVKLFLRASPWYHAIWTEQSDFTDPTSRVMYWPTPNDDQRVARLPSRTLLGTLPSLPLAVTPETAVGAQVGTSPPTALSSVMDAQLFSVLPFTMTRT